MKLEDAEIEKQFRSKLNSWCVFNEEHRIKPGDMIFKPRNKNNPFIFTSGYGCRKCLNYLKDELI